MRRDVRVSYGYQLPLRCLQCLVHQRLFVLWELHAIVLEVPIIIRVFNIQPEGVDRYLCIRELFIPLNDPVCRYVCLPTTVVVAQGPEGWEDLEAG